MESTNKPVTPVKPPAPYIGGKIRLADAIVRIINQTPHTTYAECFVGMGGVFFRREFMPKSEVINDYSKDVSGLFKILRFHFESFMQELTWNITSRDYFDNYKLIDPDSMTDLQRAARFLYLQRNSFGGKVSGRSFGVDSKRSGRFNITKLQATLDEVHTRLSGVTIECLDYKKFIDRYDHNGCLFYLDPPYYGCEKDYGADLFSRDEFQLMADLLKGIKGKFIMSINDTPEIREIFQDFNLDAVETTYTVGGGENQTKAGELIITNYIPDTLLL